MTEHEPTQSADQPTGAAPTQQQRPVILAVDDDPGVLGAVRGDLRRHYGRTYRVLTASGGAEAIETLRQLKLRGDRVAVVVSDQRMPDVTGDEVLAAARDLFEGVRTVLLTAYADTEVAIGAINDLHLDYYILKPWDPPEERLFPVLDDLLEDWHAMHQPTDAVTRVVGSRWSTQTHAIRDFLQRNQIPMQWLDVEVSEEGRRLAVAAGDVTLPLVLTPDGQHLAAPDVATLAAALGHQTHAVAESFDLAIVGAGPAGLAAAVYGASEGLRTVMVEQEATGGQAGTSSRIENYLGFPAGLSGSDLARRGTDQARRLGAELLTVQEAVGLEVDGAGRFVKLSGGGQLSANCVLVASGVSYNQLRAPGFAELTGAGVYYGAALAEARACADQHVVVIGGANSAGQAAVYFSRYAAKVTMLVRADSLAKSMSHYLIDQLAALPNVEVRARSEALAAEGEGDHLKRLRIRNPDGGETVEDVDACFVFIGAAPRTDWLDGVVQRDERGFILAGPDVAGPGWTLPRDPYPLETSVPGVFVAGDVRASSI
jgi:thioredoxin reductase (NADPH)